MSTLHITNGDCAAGTMRQFLRDPVVITAEPLFEVPPPLDSESWDPLITKADEFDEVVLWFEHDLYDQLLLIRTLDLIARLKPRAPASLICIDRFPGVEPFYGLGQLDAAQLASLVDTRRPVTPEQFALAAKAWNAFRAPDPTALLAMMRDTTALPFLGDALKRFLQEYPSTANGLSRSGEAVLRELEAGPRNGHDLFVATQAREVRPFMGDWSLFDLVHQLANARVPLVTMSPAREQGRGAANDSEKDLRQHVITITPAGRDVLAGRQDAVAVNGIDLWRGGVRLVASSGADGSLASPKLRSSEGGVWRWDGPRETLV